MARTRASGSGRSAGRTANGSGSVVARTLAGGSTVYDVFWSYLDVDGNRKRGVKYGFASSRDAEKHRRTVTATVDARAYVPPQRMTVAEYLTEWLDGLRLKPQTLSGYRRRIRLQIVPAIGHLPLDELRAMHLNKLYRQMEQRGGARGGPLSLTTVREVHNIVSSAYFDAVMSGLVDDSPTRRADPPTERDCKARRPEVRVDRRAATRLPGRQRRRPLPPDLARRRHHRAQARGDPGAAVGRRRLRHRPRVRAPTPRLRRHRPRGPKRLVFGPVKNHTAYVVHLDTATVAVPRQHRAAQARDRLALGTRWVDQEAAGPTGGADRPRRVPAAPGPDPGGDAGRAGAGRPRHHRPRVRPPRSARARPDSTQHQLGAALGIDRSTTVTLLAGLQARGLITRGPDPTNRRAHRVALTDGGQRLRARAATTLADCDERFLNALPARERTQLYCSLRLLLQ